MTTHTDGEGKQLVDLAATFGRRFRVSREADGVTWFDWPEADRPWLYEIRGRRGVVWPHGGTRLGASSESPRIAAKLQALPFATPRGSEAIEFDVEHAETVFKIIRPYRRRQVSEAERARLRELGAAYRFEKGAIHGVESVHSEPGATIEAATSTAVHPPIQAGTL
jgi:hypothetical protein